MQSRRHRVIDVERSARVWELWMLSASVNICATPRSDFRVTFRDLVERNSRHYDFRLWQTLNLPEFTRIL